MGGECSTYGRGGEKVYSGFGVKTGGKDTIGEDDIEMDF
jgi:hypothetical protein